MKVTITEALRLKNEVSQIVNKVNAMAVDYGITKENGEESVISDRDSFIDQIDKLEKILKISEAINSILAKFSVDSGVSDLVRKSKNIELQKQLLERSMGYKQTSRLSYQVVGNERVAVKTEFVPYFSGKQIKEKIAGYKSILREVTSKIDVANSSMVELPFEYSDLEGFE